MSRSFGFRPWFYRLRKPEIVRDNHLMFREIFPRYQDMADAMLEIQLHAARTREVSLEWASRLRFLRVPGLGESPDILPLVAPREHADQIQYLAVSYCWPSKEYQEDLGEDQTEFKIETSNGLRPSRASAQTLRRAISFAKSQRLSYIWIDQECIEQDNPEDKQIGIQAMDFVYRRCAAAVGLISLRINSQELIDDLHHVLEHQCLRGSNHNLARPVNQCPAFDGEGMAQFLDALYKDRFFNRAWIYQEIVCAQKQMTLLIGCSGELEVPSVLGNIESEVAIHYNTVQSLEHQAMIYYDGLTLIRTPVDTSSRSSQIAHTLRLDSHPSDCGLISEQLEKRGITIESDRLAILANSMGYHIRIDPAKMTGGKWSYTACVVVLAMMNGLIPYGSSIRRFRELDLDLFLGLSFMHDMPRQRPWGLCPPSQKLQHVLSGDPYLMKDDYSKPSVSLERSRPFGTISEDGLLMPGWLYKVGKKVHFESIQEKYSHLNVHTHSYGREECGPRDCVAERALIKDLLWALMSMRHNKAAHTLWMCLTQPEATDVFRTNHWFKTSRILAAFTKRSPGMNYNRLFDTYTKEFFSSTSFDLDKQKDIHMIAKNIVRHGYLRFGTLERTRETGQSEPDAIFLCTEKSYVYVGCGGEDPVASRYPLTGANFTHMLDVWKEEEDSQSSLFVKGSMYGIWNASSLDRRLYFFPWDDGNLPTRNVEFWNLQHVEPTEQEGRSSILQISYGDYTSRPTGLLLRK
jgi:Heterokaryon incompatibility protein (HET)